MHTHTPEKKLRIHSWIPAIRDTLGPGLRAVVWVQGCSLHCPGCMVPETWSTQGGQWVNPGELGHQVLQQQDIDGISVSGGEPAEQAGAVAELFAVIKQSGRHTWLYSGYALEELVAKNDPACDAMLALTDVLVDGRYEPAQGGHYHWRGSANQRVLRLTQTPVPDARSTGFSQVEIILDDRGKMRVIGIPPPDFLNQFRQTLAKRGVFIRPQSAWK